MDLLVVKAAFKKWAKVVNKKNSNDPVKLGLVKNGTMFFMASVVLIAKCLYCNELVDEYIKNQGDTDKKIYLISGLSFNHGFLRDGYDEVCNDLALLFETIYGRYIEKNYSLMKNSRPEIIYSNYTKVDKNYQEWIARDIIQDFIDGIAPAMKSFVDNVYYKETPSEEDEDKKLTSQYISDYNKQPESITDDSDPLEAELEEKIKDYRDRKAIDEGKKAKADIFTNQEMKSIVNLKPATVEDMIKFNCFRSHPKVKAGKYGDDIINIIDFVLKRN